MSTFPLDHEKAIINIVHESKYPQYSQVLKLTIHNLHYKQQEIYIFSETSRPSLGPTQPPTQWIVEVSVWKQNSWVMSLTSQIHLILFLLIWLYNSLIEFWPSQPTLSIFFYLGQEPSNWVLLTSVYLF